MAKVIAVCISEKKGTQKHEVDGVTLVPDYGIENDAHAGKWHRQVSLLNFEKIEDFRAKGVDVDFGAFGENIIIDEIDFRTLPIGTRFEIGDALLELTQIGKECHSHCAIFMQLVTASCQEKVYLQKLSKVEKLKWAILLILSKLIQTDL